MTGHILLVNHASHHLDGLESLLHGARYPTRRVDRDALTDALAGHDLIVLPYDVTLDNPDLVARLATSRAGRGIVLVDPAGDRDRRLAGLRLGADDVVPDHAPAEVVLARLRALLRRQMALSDLLPAGDPTGFADMPATFCGAAGPAPAIGLLRMTQGGPCPSERMARATGLPIRPLTPEELFTGPVDTDVVIVPVPPDPRHLRGLSLADLRARGKARHCAVLALADPEHPATLARAFDLGADDGMLGAGDGAEMALRLTRLAAHKRRADRMRAALAEGWALAVTDPLTGLSNRRAGLAQLAHCIGRAQQDGREFAVLLMDFDHFKRINDAHGHLSGDTVLTEAAKRFAACLRPDDVLARIGGEEFLAILPDTGIAQARRIAEKLRRRIEYAPFDLPAQARSIPATLSIGLAMGGPNSGRPSLGALLEDADRALYAAKAGGRNCVGTARPRTAAA